MTAKRDSVQTPPGDEALLRAVRALGAALDRFDEAAGLALGIGQSDLRALNLLEHRALSASELGERLGLTSGSVTVLVDRLIKAGYVARKPGTADRRTVYVHLEPATYAAFARVYAPCGRAVADLGRAQSARQLEVALRVLDDLATVVDEQEQQLRTAGRPPV